jgi:uncharacterized MAPEG superfamily protein
VVGIPPHCGGNYTTQSGGDATVHRSHDISHHGSTDRATDATTDATVAFIMFSRFFLSLYMTGEEMVMRRSGEARRERRDKFCLFVFAYLLMCFRVSFAAVTVSTFLLFFSSLGLSPRAPCRRIK